MLCVQVVAHRRNLIRCTTSHSRTGTTTVICCGKARSGSIAPLGTVFSCTSTVSPTPGRSFEACPRLDDLHPHLVTFHAHQSQVVVTLYRGLRLPLGAPWSSERLATQRASCWAYTPFLKPTPSDRAALSRRALCMLASILRASLHSIFTSISRASIMSR